jgi:hypothetical protein
MRLTIIVALLVFPASLSAQTQPSPCSQSTSTLLDFDPYKPSNLSIVRNYGGTVLAQAPLEELLKLDPYVPTEAALLRQLGGAMPFWAFATYPWSVPVRQHMPCEPATEPPAATLTSFSDVLAVLEQRPPGATPPPHATTPEASHGVSIQYDGRVWTSAGPAVRFSESEFVRVGDRAGFPIFRRATGDDDVIYVRTTAGMVAPFRAVR